jgi:hypothetical protein
MIGSAAVFAAQPREGIKVGLMTGLNFHIGAMGEYNFGPASASAVLGYGFNAFMLRLGGDYNFDTPFVNSDWGLDLYLSVGGHLDIFISGGAAIALGIPVTWSWYMDDVPLKIFVKAGPELGLTGGGIAFIGSAGALYQL